MALHRQLHTHIVERRQNELRYIQIYQAERFKVTKNT